MLYSPKELYSISKILSTIEEGDSLSEIHIKTGLSFTTVQKTIDKLEDAGLITTKKTITSRGRVRKCVSFSFTHKLASIYFLNVFNKFNALLEGDKNNSLIFEIIILKKAIDEINSIIRTEISQESINLFKKWVDFNKMPEQIIKHAVKESFSINNKKIFDPQKIIIKAELTSDLIKIKEKKISSLDMF